MNFDRRPKGVKDNSVPVSSY